MAQAITPVPPASMTVSTLLSHPIGNVRSAAEKTCQRDEEEVLRRPAFASLKARETRQSGVKF